MLVTHRKPKTKSKVALFFPPEDEGNSDEGAASDDSSDPEDHREGKQPQETKDQGPIDMRSMFPIDESHEYSSRVMAVLTHFMRKLSRKLTETEQMSYVYMWMALGANLVQVNASEYDTQNMKYIPGDVQCTCFRAEIIGRLHLVCYETFHQAVDYVHSLLHNASVSPIVLEAPVQRSTPLDMPQLCTLLQLQVEMCRVAVDHFHRTWEDFDSAFDRMQPQEAQVHKARMSAAHTGTLGTIASHLIQVLKNCSAVKDKENRYFLKWAWESAVVLFMAQGLLPYDEQDARRLRVWRLASQLKVLVYRHHVELFIKEFKWAHAVYFQTRLNSTLGLGAYGDNAALRGNDDIGVTYAKELEVLRAKCYSNHVPFLVADDPEPMKQLDKFASDMRLSQSAVQTMAINALSTMYKLRVEDRRMLFSFPGMVLRLRSGKLMRMKPLDVMYNARVD